MILGIGIDIVEVERMTKALEKKGFRQRVFTAGEREYCDSRGRQRFQSYAARFAAKEAVLKALGTGLRQGTLQEVEVVSDALGKPGIVLHGGFACRATAAGVKEIHLSLTHTRYTACAQVLFWG